MGTSWIPDLFFPRFCLGCEAFGKYLCEKCVLKIEFYDPQTCPYCELNSPYGFTHPRCRRTWGLDGMFILAHYDGLIPEIIHRVKYRGEYALLEEVAGIITTRYHGKYNFDYLVPVPLAPKREKERGFNQAGKLAEQICLQSTVYRPRQEQKAVVSSRWLVVNLLSRTRETKPQFELKYDERKQNMKDAFALAHNLITNNLSGYSFCLVDDVATTGATIFECAKVLKRAGAKNIWAMAIARGGGIK